MSKIAFLFPGQGAQTVSMGRTLYDSVPAARALFDQARAILDYDLAAICFTGPEATLNSTVISQPAIFVTSLAALEALKQTDPAAVSACEAAAGLSLGEYTALVFAGAMCFEDGLKLVHQRGDAMQAASDATPSGMVSVLGLELLKVEALCRRAGEFGRVWIANLLCPGNIAVSGDRAACDAVERLASEMGALKTIRLAVAGAFHTEIMKPADHKLAVALDQIVLQKPQLPVWSNVDALPHTDPKEIKELLIRQLLQPVLWEQTMRGMLAGGFDRYYEIGPGRVLAGLLKRVQRKVDCQNIGA